jgi:hypothetical protein
MNISGKIIQSYSDSSVQRPHVNLNVNVFGEQVAVEVVNETVLVKQEVFSSSPCTFFALNISPHIETGTTLLTIISNKQNLRIVTFVSLHSQYERAKGQMEEMIAARNRGKS